jgi:pyridoxine kinase
MKRQKRVAAIHDISCFGKCSLTVALPIISAAGIEVSIIPTAILSTHTGGFTGYTFRGLTEDILPIARHWKALGLRFDAIYSGYLGSFEQLDIVSEVFDLLKTPETLIVVDPVMADHGRLYASFPETFPEGMKRLCSRADVITPNITEAALLLGLSYSEGPYERRYIDDMLRGLSRLGPKRVALTGVYFDEKKLGAASFDGRTGRTAYAFSALVEGYYHGTGDIFASALTACLLGGLTLEAALQTAVDFTAGSIRRTREAGTDVRFGVNFEAGLKEFAEKMEALSS